MPNEGWRTLPPGWVIDPPPEPEPTPTGMDAAVGLGLRMIPAIGGALINPIAGGFAGAAVGETAAEAYERWRGLRRNINPAQVLTQGALGAIPMGKTASVLSGLAKGATLGAGASIATPLAEGEMPTSGGVLTGAALGGVLGAGGHALAARLMKGRMRPVEPVAEPMAPVAAPPPRLAPGLAGAQGYTDVVTVPYEPPFQSRYGDVDALRNVQSRDAHPYETAVLRGLGRVISGERPETVDLTQAQRPMGYTPYGPYRATVEAEGRIAPMVRLKVDPTAPVPPGPGRALMRVEPEAPPQAKPVRLVPPQPERFGERKGLPRASDESLYQSSREEYWRARGVSQAQGEALLELQRTMDTGSEKADYSAMAQVFPDKKARPTLAQAKQVIQSILDGNPLDKKLEKFKVTLLTAAEEHAGVSRDYRAAHQMIQDLTLEQAENMGRTGGAGRTRGAQTAWSWFHVGGKRARDAVIRELMTAEKMDRETAAAIVAQMKVRDVVSLSDELRAAKEAAEEAASTGRADFWQNTPTTGVPKEDAWNERGFITPQVSTSIAGALGGAAYGGTQGDTPEERLMNAAMYGAAGAAAGYGLAAGVKGLSGRPVGAVAPTTPEPPVVRPMTSRGRERVINRETGVKTPPPGKIRPDRMVNFTAAQLPDEDRAMIQQAYKQAGGYAAQRGGTQSDERTKALARRLSVVLTRAHRPNERVSSESIWADVDAMTRAGEDMRLIADDIAKNGLTGELALKLEEAKAVYYTIVGNVAQDAATAGRALRILGVAKRIERTKDPLLWRNVLGDDAIKELEADAQKIAELSNNPDKLLEYLMTSRLRTKWDTLSDLQITNLLSGWKTQQRNIFGNVAKMPFDVAAREASAAWEKMRGVPDVQRTHLAVGPVEGLRLFASAVMPAWRESVNVMRHGLTPAVMKAFREGALAEEQLPTEFGPLFGRLGGASGGANPFNWVRRLMSAGDTFFREVTESVERRLATQVYLFRQGAKEGLKGDALWGYVTQRLPDALVEPPEEVLKHVEQVVRRSTYQEKVSGNSLVGKLIAWKAGLKNPVARTGANMVVPFLRTPYNIIRQGLEYSPAGLIYNTARKQALTAEVGGRLANEMQMRGAIGTALMAPVALWAYAGNISGAGPKDRAVRDQLMATGWRPNSIRLPDYASFKEAWQKANGPMDLLDRIASPDQSGGVWVNYSLMQPLAVPMSMIANAFDAWRDNGKDPTPADGPTLAAKIGMRAVESLKQQSFFEGLQNIFDAFENPDGLAQGLVRNFVTMNIPASGFLRNVTQVVDPTVRYPRTLGESVRTVLPGLSETVRPKLNVWGEPVQRDPGGLPWGLGVQTGVPEMSPVTRGDTSLDALQRTGVTVRDIQGPPYLTMRGERIPLTAEASVEAGRMRGQTLRRVMDAVVESPGFVSMPLPAQREVLERVKQRVNARVMGFARGTLLRDHGTEVLERLIASRSTERP